MWIPLRVPHALEFLCIKPLQKKTGELEITTNWRGGLELVCTSSFNIIFEVYYTIVFFAILRYQSRVGQNRRSTQLQAFCSEALASKLTSCTAKVSVSIFCQVPLIRFSRTVVHSLLFTAVIMLKLSRVVSTSSIYFSN